MNKRSYIRPVGEIVGLIIISALFSCENPFIYNKCPDCYNTEPITAEITAKLSPASLQGMPTKINVYDGLLEDGVLIGTYESFSTEWRCVVKVNKRYTVTATYYYYGTNYVCIDDARPGVRYQKLLCEQPCFQIVENNLDLRIKGL
jgi:hypothetical protein